MLRVNLSHDVLRNVPAKDVLQRLMQPLCRRSSQGESPSINPFDPEGSISEALNLTAFPKPRGSATNGSIEP